MSAVRYDLETDAQPLIDGFEKATRAMAAAEQQAEETAAAANRLNNAASAAGKKGAKDLEEGMKGVERVAKTIGGPLGAAADTVFDLEEGFSRVAKSLGPAGAALASFGAAFTGVGLLGAGLAAGLVSAVTATVDLGRAAADAEPNVRGLLDDAVIDSAEGLGDRLAVLDQRTDALTVRFATLRDGVEGTVDALIGATVVAENLMEAFDDLAQTDAVDKLQEIAQTMLRIGTLGVSDAVMAVAGALIEEGKSVEEVLQTVIKTSELATIAANLAAEAERKAKERAREAEAAARDWADAVIDAGKAIEQAESDIVTPLEEANREYAERLRLANEVEAVTGDAALANQVRNAATLRLERDKAEILKDEIQLQVDLLEAEAERITESFEIWAETEEAKTKKAEEEAKKRAAAEQVLADGLLEAGAAIADTFVSIHEQRITALEAERDRLKDLLANSKDLTEAERDRAEASLATINNQLKQQGDAIKRGFVAQRVAALGQLAFNMAMMYTAMTNALVPVTGPFAPAAALAITAPIGIAQTAAIWAQPMPTLHSGTMGADEQVWNGAKVRQGEGAVVFNQRAVEDGALDRAVRENQGERQTREARLVLADAGRVVGELVARESRRPGSAVAAAFGTYGTGSVDPYGSW